MRLGTCERFERFAESDCRSSSALRFILSLRYLSWSAKEVATFLSIFAVFLAGSWAKLCGCGRSKVQALVLTKTLDGTRKSDMRSRNLSLGSNKRAPHATTRDAANAQS